MTRFRKKPRAPKVKELLRAPDEIHHNDPLLTPAQTAKRLGIAIDTLTLWRCTERVPLAYAKVGRLVRYLNSDVEAFIQARRVVPSQRASA